MSNFKNKIQKKEKGIWRYANFYDKFIKPENRLSLNDSINSIYKAIKIKSLQNVYFKREDENESGSLKGRSLAYQISLARQNGLKSLVISTSGNAGIAAAAYCQKAGIRLYVFISPETEKEKIAEMQKYKPVIIESKRAIRLASYLSAKYKIRNLRPSIDDTSIEGFKSIAFEIFENLGEIDAIFTFVTSGSSFIGMARAYKYLLENKEIKSLPELYAVQSGNIFSIAEEFDKKNILKSSGSETGAAVLAGKLGVKKTRRKKEILEFIKSSGGSGIYINDNEIAMAKNILEKNNIYTSPEGCASFAGVMKVGEGKKFNKAVCILSGKARDEADEIDKSGIYKAEGFEEVDEIMNSNIKNQNEK